MHNFNVRVPEQRSLGMRLHGYKVRLDNFNITIMSGLIPRPLPFFVLWSLSTYCSKHKVKKKKNRGGNESRSG